MPTDPLSIASFSLQIVSKTTDGLNALRERAQRSKDVEIKDEINALYDNVMGLKGVLSRFLEDNKDLQRQLDKQRHAEKPKIGNVGDASYYFLGEEGPYCQPCYEGPAKTLVALTPNEDFNGGIRRRCPLCKEYFYEKKMDFGLTGTRRAV